MTTTTRTITADAMRGPMGRRGFRNGEFPVTIDGEKYLANVTVPHSLSLDDQCASIIQQVELYLKNNGDDPSKSGLLRKDPNA